MAGLDARARRDLDVLEQDALLQAELVDEGTKRLVGILDGLAPPDAAAEANEDDVGPLVWQALPRRVIALPHYPWQRERHVPEAPAAAATPAGAAPAPAVIAPDLAAARSTIDDMMKTLLAMT